MDLDGNNAGRALVVIKNFSDLTFRRIGSSFPSVGSVAIATYCTPNNCNLPNAAQPFVYLHNAATHELETNEQNALSSSVVLRNGELHGVQGVNSGGNARLRYFRVRVEHDAATDAFNFTLLDDRLVPVPASASDLNAFYGSVAVNEAGQVAIGFTGSSGSQYASAFAVVGERDSNDHIAFGDPIQLKTGHAVYEVGTRDNGAELGGNQPLGDYNATRPIPRRSIRFWTIRNGRPLWTSWLRRSARLSG